MEGLNTIKHPGESVINYHIRIKKIYTRILHSITCQTREEQISRNATIPELTLQRFIYHSTPDLSKFLRGRDHAL